MSFQHEEQEFDFSYVFEYSQDVQKEPETGGYSSNEGLLFFCCVTCILHTVMGLLCTGINAK